MSMARVVPSRSRACNSDGTTEGQDTRACLTTHDSAETSRCQRRSVLPSVARLHRSPMCSLIGRPRVDRQTTMVVASTAYNLFLNRKPMPRRALLTAAWHCARQRRATDRRASRLLTMSRKLCRPDAPSQGPRTAPSGSTTSSWCWRASASNSWLGRTPEYALHARRSSSPGRFAPLPRTGQVQARGHLQPCPDSSDGNNN